MCTGIESILDAMSQAAVAMSVESIVESWISVLERQSGGQRNLQQTRLDDEMTVAVNGPEVHNSAGVISEAMQSYWAESRREWAQQQGHWYRVSSSFKLKQFGASKSIDGLKNAKPKFLFQL